jgi:replicative DNA helicase
MDSGLYSVLKYEHISKATDSILTYMDERRRGISESLQTRWPKFNRMCMGGVEPNTIYTIAGISGAGKSSFVNSLESDLFELNPKANFIILNFTFEMISSRQVGRKLSYHLNRTTSELYSGDKSKPLNEEDFNNAKEYAEEIKKQKIFYVEVPGNVQEVRNTIIHFQEHEAKGKWLIIILDHALLTKGRSGDKEREILADLQYMFMEIKKFGRNTIIELSQLNRDIESVERINNNYMHYPMRKDIFGSEAIYQASDYVIVLHRPELLGIKDENYGPNNLPTRNLIYLHLLKNREGEVGIIQFENNLKYNRIDEYESKKDTQQTSFF